MSPIRRKSKLEVSFRTHPVGCVHAMRPAGVSDRPFSVSLSAKTNKLQFKVKETTVIHAALFSVVELGAISKISASTLTPPSSSCIALDPIHGQVVRVRTTCVLHVRRIILI